VAHASNELLDVKTLHHPMTKDVFHSTRTGIGKDANFLRTVLRTHIQKVARRCDYKPYDWICRIDSRHPYCLFVPSAGASLLARAQSQSQRSALFHTSLHSPDLFS
jgi:hypothetical protein